MEGLVESASEPRAGREVMAVEALAAGPAQPLVAELSRSRANGLLRARLTPFAPPEETLQRIRWVFLLFSLGSALLLAGVMVTGASGSPAQAYLGVSALAVLAFKWLWEYTRGELPAALDLAETAGLVVVGSAVGSPLNVLLLLYARLSYRMFQASSPRATMLMACYVFAYFASAVLGGQRGLSPFELVFLASGFPLVTVVMRLLATTLSEGSFRLLFASNPQAMWVYDLETLKFLEVNAAAIERYGYSRQEFIAMTVDQIRPPAEVLGLHAGTNQRRSSPEQPGTSHHQLKDGRVITVEVTSHRVTFAGHPAALVLAADVTEQRILDGQLRHQAFHDPLTNLANRALFRDRLEHALEQRDRHDSPCAVLFFDIDNFKAINDSDGHTAGDALLIQVAERLRSLTRTQDTAARLGGDEFGLLLEDVAGIWEAVAVGERVIAALHQPFKLGDEEWYVSASLGVALSSEDHAGVDGIMRDADVAMYSAKAAGKDRVGVFEPAMYSAVLERRALQADLRNALETNGLTLVYQPEFDATTRRLVAVEALVRWPHPRRGMIPPADFIPVAEETGLIDLLDSWVLRTACLQLQAWNAAGLRRVGMAVNVSGRELSDAELAPRIAAVLSETGISPGQLELEVTETAAVETENALPTLTALRALGVQIAIDDFGVGYSMLGRLQHFPVQKLKIDRSFVREVTVGEDEAPIVSGIIAMGHSLGLKVLAEGVETTEQLRFLRRLGCDLVQGFLLGKPMEGDRVRELLERESAGASVS